MSATSQAQAQSCTPEVLFESATGFEGRDASGNTSGFNTNNLKAGDFIIFEEAVVAGYNPNAVLDIVMEITGTNLNSAVPPHSSSTNAVTLSADGVLAVSRSIARADSYVSFRILPMRGGSVTSTVASGTQLSLQNTVVSLQDVDSVNRNSNNSDVAGIANSNPGSPTITLNSTSQIGFQNGGGPTGFTFYTDTPASLSPPNWSGINGGGFTDNTVDLDYAVYTSGEFLHGFTGSTTGRNNRGGIFAMCGEIAPAELTSSKSVDSIVENPDGTVAVSYTINMENTGQQALTGLVVTDDLDTVFSTPFDAFIPSVSSDTSGGLIAQDATATIITDTGSPIGTVATNPFYDGGSDINLFDPLNTIIMDPGDQIQVSFTIQLEPNLTGGDVSFVNDVGITMTDEFNLPVDGSTSSPPVTIDDVTPSLSMTKVADDTGPHTVGDVITYTYTVKNDGNQIIRDVTIGDTHNGSDPAPTPGSETLLTDAAPTGDSTDAAINGSWDVLAPGDSLTFTGTYTVTQTDAENS